MGRRFYNIVFWVLLVLAGVYFLSCNAPRNNPLDPENPDNQLSLIEGHINTLLVPFKPIAGVNVYWKYEDRYTVTDENGFFQIPNLTPNNGWLVYQKEGFCTDSVLVDWLGVNKINLNLSLNSIPIVDSLFLYSAILHRFPSLQIQQIILRTVVTDQDNDIDTVFVFIPFKNYKRHLDYNISSKFYERTITPVELGINNLEEIVGKKIEIIVKDLMGNKFTVTEDIIKRVIRDEVRAVFPLNNQTVGSQPVLRWEKFILSYPFTYTVEVFTNEINPQLVMRKEGIASNNFTFQVEEPLPSGDLFWIIWCIDEHQNRSRSKPASFITISD